MRCGDYEVSALVTGTLRLDGGAMFGNVPRVLWEPHHAPDATHRINLVMRVLLIEGQGRRVLVDTGSGNLWSDKEQRIYDLEAPPTSGVLAALAERGVSPEEVSDVILTHLHFDHAGGLCRRGRDGEPVPAFPAARHHVQRRNLETAQQPGPREKASYLERHWRVLEKVALTLHEGAVEVLPGIHVEPSEGHTCGLQVVRVGEEETAVLFPADVVPLATHVAIPWTMGYDLSPRTLMKEKLALLGRAAEEGWTLVPEHDPGRQAFRVKRQNDRFSPAETVEL